MNINPPTNSRPTFGIADAPFRSKPRKNDEEEEEHVSDPGSTSDESWEEEEEEEKDEDENIKKATHQVWPKWEETKEEMTQKTLTFGCKQEFPLAFQPPGKSDPDPQDPRQIHGIVTSEKNGDDIEGANDEADSASSSQTDSSIWGSEESKKLKLTYKQEVESHIIPTVRKYGISAASSSDSQRIEDWLVTDDPRVSATHPNYGFMPIKIKSPPLYYRKESLLQVGAVSQILTSSYRAVCNDQARL